MASTTSNRSRHRRQTSAPSSLTQIGLDTVASSLTSPTSTMTLSSSSVGPSPRPSPRRSRSRKELPPLFWYMEAGEWEKATERVRRHPREVKTWAAIKTKTTTATTEGDQNSASSTTGTKRLALHHACFKLRGAGSTPPPLSEAEDPFIQVCRFILMLARLYPEAAGQRESRHGCLPLHLAAFASCAARKESSTNLKKPSLVSRRCSSDATTASNLSAVHAAEQQVPSASTYHRPTVSVSTKNYPQISAKREAYAVQVVNALLDAYPKAIRVDSEGGRLPLHTACAGRATPLVVATLVTAYPAAARHRNKDGFLPLHLAAHWGVSHPNVAITLLKAYPDATVGRNRWERTPLEEALCMAGENGRPHQSALVRALRKHPSFWTKPVSELFGDSRQQRVSTAVDVDESVTTEDEQLQQEQQQYSPSARERALVDDLGFASNSELGQEVTLDPVGTVSAGGFVGRLVSGMKNTSPKSPPKGSVNGDLALPLETLIQRQKWNSVLARIKTHPLEPEEDLKVITRGGFLANTGMTALHFACERDPPLQVVQALIEAYPVAVLTRCMPGGCLPLHVACTWLCSPAVVRALLSADPGSCRIKDELGNVALHSACFSGADLTIVAALLDTDPKSVVSRNHQGSQPMDICKRLRHENRRLVMSVLATKREDIMAKYHMRSNSSGTWAEVAREAEALNQRYGTPTDQNGPDLQDNGFAVEVSYQGQDSEELQWI